MPVDVTENRASRIGEWPSKDMATRKLEKSLRDNSRVIATAVGGETVSIDLVGDPEELYRIEWGDGTMERGEFPDPASVSVSHEYDAGTEVYEILQWGGEADIRTIVISDIGGTTIGQLKGIDECGLILVLNLSGIAHINGDLSTFSHKPDMTDLIISGSDLTGDLIALAAMPVLANVNLDDTGVNAYTTGVALPAWDGIAMSLQNLTILNTEVDAFLQDLDTDGAVNGTLDMTGSTPRTSASDTAVANLIAAGWTLTIPAAA